MPSDLFFTALWRARQTTDDFGNVVRILEPQYSIVVDFYCEED
jgi:hypothetical protein